MEKTQLKQCPFLVIEGKTPKCKVKRQTGGDDHGYLPLLPSDVDKCLDVFETCPSYRNAAKKTCLNCEITFLKAEAGNVTIDGAEHLICPECGSSGVSRQVRSPNEEEEVVEE